MRSQITHAIAIAILIGFTALTGARGQGGSICSAAEAAKHINETATVGDVVVNVHESR